MCFSTPKELLCIPTKTLTELWEYFWSVSEIVTQWLTCNLFSSSLAKLKAAASLISSFTCIYDALIWLLKKQIDGLASSFNSRRLPAIGILGQQQPKEDAHLENHFLHIT